MSTVQAALPRRYRHPFLVGIIDVLCVSALVAAIIEFRPAPRDAAVVTVPAATGLSDGVAGGRAGGITSSDTTNDALIRISQAQSVAAGGYNGGAVARPSADYPMGKPLGDVPATSGNVGYAAPDRRDVSLVGHC